MSVGRKLILWTGQRHSGKTTAAGDLIENLRARGRVIAGLLAPSVYQEGLLIGFDAVDVSTGRRAPLLRRFGQADAVHVGAFAFIDEGLRLGRAALDADATREADLVVVDEFGPLELRGGGWRGQVDQLIAGAARVILLVVRAQLVPEIERLYSGVSCTAVPAADPKAPDAVTAILKGAP